jgi:chromosome segregation ATPase
MTNDELAALEKRVEHADILTRLGEVLSSERNPYTRSTAVAAQAAIMRLEDKIKHIRDERQKELASLRRQLAEKEAERDTWKACALDIKSERDNAIRDAASLQSQLTAERERAEKAERHLELSRRNIVGVERDRDEFWNKFQAEVKRGKTAREERDAALASIAEKEARIAELQADWRETIRANAEEVCSLQSQLTAERERAERMREEEVTASICFDKVVKDRDAALAEARELREELNAAYEAMTDLCDFAWSAVSADCDEARQNLNGLLSKLRSHRDKLAKLTEGA